MGSHVVTRRCVFCREVKELDSLIRVARAGGEVFIDHKKKAQGRGAYLCKSGKCIKGAAKSRALQKSLKCAVGEEIYEKIIGEYADESR